MRTIVRPEAESDLAQAYAWYELQRSGLGREFMEEVSRCIQSIDARPLSFTQAYPSVRRAIVHRFPYALFFVVGVEATSVVAAFHMARHPRALTGRLGPAL